MKQSQDEFRKRGEFTLCLSDRDCVEIVKLKSLPFTVTTSISDTSRHVLKSRTNSTISQYCISPCQQAPNGSCTQRGTLKPQATVGYNWIRQDKLVKSGALLSPPGIIEQARLLKTESETSLPKEANEIRTRYHHAHIIVEVLFCRTPPTTHNCAGAPRCTAPKRSLFDVPLPN